MSMENPNVHIIGHSGNPSFPIYEEEVVKKAKEKDIMIELNNSSFVSSRKGSDVYCTKIAKLCKECGTRVVMGSDAHTCFHIGEFSEVINLLKSIQMPEKLVMNTSKKKFIEYLKNKNKLIDV